MKKRAILSNHNWAFHCAGSDESYFFDWRRAERNRRSVSDCNGSTTYPVDTFIFK